jgi:hypothetical protein
LKQFENNWVTSDILSIFLKNASQRYRDKGKGKGKGKEKEKTK